MTIASEITRLQGAKSSIRASIINKGVSVPSTTRLDEYPTLIDSIQAGSIEDMMATRVLYIPGAFTRRDTSVVLYEIGADAISPDGNTYYYYFWSNLDSSIDYSEFKLSILVKHPLEEFTMVRSGLVASDLRGLRRRGYRIKKEGNNVIFSALYSEDTSSSSNYKNHFYCVNATNTTFSSKIDLGIMEDIGADAVYENWTKECGITAEETIPSVNKIASIEASEMSSYMVNLKITLNE